MKRSIKDLLGYTIEALDGPKGKVRDFLFDEESWVIRYIEVDFGGFFNKKKVLVPREFLQGPLWDEKRFPIKLSQQAIEDCPGIEFDLPISREYEKQLSEHYNYNQYWPHTFVSTSDAGGLYFPTRPMRVPDKMIDEQELNSSLRSFNEIKGYDINTTDGKLGHLDDLIVDDLDWQIVYAIVDTSDWQPWSKKVMLSIAWLNEISYMKGEVGISLQADTIKDAPAYESDHPISASHEESLYNYFNKSFYEYKSHH